MSERGGLSVGDICQWTYAGSLVWNLGCGANFVEVEKGEVDDFSHCPYCGDEIATLRPVSYYDGMDDAE